MSKNSHKHAHTLHVFALAVKLKSKICLFVNFSAPFSKWYENGESFRRLFERDADNNRPNFDVIVHRRAAEWHCLYKVAMQMLQAVDKRFNCRSDRPAPIASCFEKTAYGRYFVAVGSTLTQMKVLIKYDIVVNDYTSV